MAATENQTVELTPAAAAIVQEAMGRGCFASVSDFVEQAVSTWREAQTLTPEEAAYMRGLLQEQDQREVPT